MSLTITVAGEALLLLPQKAVYWPSEQVLVVADIHFGKAAAFRALGVPVPAGTTGANLAALDALLGLYPVREILFLGDFLHSRTARAPATLTAMQAWRARWPQVQLTLVRGNHDAHAGDPPAALGMLSVDEPYQRGPFACCHHPQPVSGSVVLAGHLHPVYHLRAGWETVRLPCFLLAPGRLVLPSFGAFTGGHAVQPEPGERVFVTSGETVLEIP
ncbi:ligase-associated DNA damage response endonuclease PdeM [Pseudoduganella sp. FT55W]|uniref:Ligase-associated DNA damage response endonuclease PdeM n=1 Tax=Duganella rivi TaxID=2666083 RepID=A0A7X4GMC6_9BURK|nr:ligase-associated DNA damage response endonuclease PdeM [Duganella rivi]MYM66133.1 ligase-associated DNA damage response endonuclease PdeM [Duganella rivi]